MLSLSCFIPGIGPEAGVACSSDPVCVARAKTHYLVIALSVIIGVG
jgi:hypothetical protein